MPAKTLLQLCNEITLITENIKEHFPELHQQLKTDLTSPATLPPNKRSKRENFQVYLNTLKNNLQQQLTMQQIAAQALPDLSKSLTYNPESFEKLVLHQQAGQKTLLFAFAKDQELKTHTAPHDVLLVMLEGLCTFTLDLQESQILHAGQVIRIPGKVKHSLKALSDFKMLLLL